MSQANDLLLSRIDDRGDAGHIAYLTVNNPSRRNALGMAGKRAIAATFNRLAHDDKLRAAVITGAGDKSFIAGADIHEMKDLTPEEAEVEHTLTHVANEAIRNFPVPVIARSPPLSRRTTIASCPAVALNWSMAKVVLGRKVILPPSGN